MIIGIGNDLVDIRRIEESLTKFGEKFEARVFTPAEIATANGRSKAGERIKASTLAKRFAAKESLAKALGTGFSEGISWQEVEISNLPSGKPKMMLTGSAVALLRSLTPKGKTAQIDLSLADDYPYAQAFVVISVK